MPGKVFSLIASVSTTCFIFIWGAIVLAHLAYRKKVGKQRSKKFRMPFFPISDYLILAFLGFITIVLCLKTETLIALVASLIWLVVLYVIKIVNEKVHASTL